MAACCLKRRYLIMPGLLVRCRSGGSDCRRRAAKRRLQPAVIEDKLWMAGSAWSFGAGIWSTVQPVELQGRCRQVLVQKLSSWQRR